MTSGTCSVYLHRNGTDEARNLKWNTAPCRETPLIPSCFSIFVESFFFLLVYTIMWQIYVLLDLDGRINGFGLTAKKWGYRKGSCIGEEGVRDLFLDLFLERDLCNVSAATFSPPVQFGVMLASVFSLSSPSVYNTYPQFIHTIAAHHTCSCV